MNKGIFISLLLALILNSQTRAADIDSSETVRFITCPVYRDTDAGRKSGCWLGDDPASGERYDFTLSPTKPLLGHPVLVEGRKSADLSTDACGAAMLQPVRVSWLAGDCPRHMLPAETFVGQRFSLPKRNVRPLYEKRDNAQLKRTEKTIHIPFDFGRDFIVYQLSDFYIDQATRYALDIDASQVIITGFAATDPVDVSGQQLAEAATLAKQRADIVAEWFTRLGYPAQRLDIRTSTAPEPIDADFADGMPEVSRRRTTIQIIP